MMKRREKMILIVLLIVWASPFAMKRLGWLEGFVGTDNQAQAMIGQIRPDYRPWFTSVFNPGEKEEWLFALQAAMGAGVFGYCLIRLRARKRNMRSQQREEDKCT